MAHPRLSQARGRRLIFPLPRDVNPSLQDDVRFTMLPAMDNPYTPSGIDPMATAGGATVSQGVLNALAGTKPWVRLCSVIGFIGAGLMVLFGLVMMVGGGFLSFAGSDAGMPFAGFPVVMGVIYLLLAFFYFFPALKLWKYGSHIVSLLGSGSTLDLEAALDAQRSFWKFVGILVCVVIALYIVGIAIAVLLMTLGASALH